MLTRKIRQAFNLQDNFSSPSDEDADDPIPLWTGDDNAAAAAAAAAAGASSPSPPPGHDDNNVGCRMVGERRSPNCSDDLNHEANCNDSDGRIGRRACSSQLCGSHHLDDRGLTAYQAAVQTTADKPLCCLELLVQPSRLLHHRDGDDDAAAAAAAADLMHQENNNVPLETTREEARPRCDHELRDPRDLDMLSEPGYAEVLPESTKWMKNESKKLFELVARNDSSGLQQLTQASSSSLIDPDVRDEVGWNPLHLAAWAGNSPMVALLIELDARCSYVDAQTRGCGSTALLLASRCGHSHTVKCLLRRRACYCSASFEQRTPADEAKYLFIRHFFHQLRRFFRLARHGDDRLMSMLSHLPLDELLAAVNARDRDGEGLASAAESRGHRHLAKDISKVARDAEAEAAHYKPIADGLVMRLASFDCCNNDIAVDVDCNAAQ